MYKPSPSPSFFPPTVCPSLVMWFLPVSLPSPSARLDAARSRIHFPSMTRALSTSDAAYCLIRNSAVVCLHASLHQNSVDLSPHFSFICFSWLAMHAESSQCPPWVSCHLVRQMLLPKDWIWIWTITIFMAEVPVKLPESLNVSIDARLAKWTLANPAEIKTILPLSQPGLLVAAATLGFQKFIDPEICSGFLTTSEVWFSLNNKKSTT